MKAALALFLALIALPAAFADEFTYGEVYLEEKQSLLFPRFSLGMGYAKDLNNTYLDVHSFAANFQLRLWKYISTGLFGQWSSSSYTSAGRQLRDLRETADLVFDTSRPRWGIYHLSNIHLILANWNFLNLTELRVKLILGGGWGMIRRQESIDSEEVNRLSYLWSVEQRLRILEGLGVYVSFFGNREGVFIHPGIFYALDF